MRKRKFDASLFQERVIKEIKTQSNELDFPNLFYDAIEKGKTNRKQFEKVEYKKFDESWIANLQSFIPSLDKITRNLRSSLRYETEILPVEKTRRTNPESIRHLMQNTRYIREITDDGIIPDKVLNTLSEIEYGIYENRFIMTLIMRIHDYLFERLKVIKENMHGFKETNFNLNNEFHLNNANYELDISIKALEEMDSKEIDEHNMRVYSRIEETYKIVSRMYHSDFMRIMMRYQKVKAPIMKTQIILKNPDFKNAYLLWLYLDRLHVLDFTLETELKNKRFNKQYHSQLDESILVLFSTVFTNSNLGSINATYDELNIRSLKPTKDMEDYVGNITTAIPEYDLEPQLATEYYLRKAKQLFNKQFQEIARNNSPEVSLKQVLLDQYSIADQVYNFYFESDQDLDVFDKLISYKDPVRKYNEANERYLVTKAARQVKEQIYRESLSLENRWAEEMVILHQEALDSLMDKGIKETDQEIEYLSNALDKELIKYERDLNQRNSVVNRNRRIANNKQITEINKRYRDMLKDFRDKEKIRLDKEKEKIKQRRIKELERIKAKAKKQREDEALKLKNKKLAAQKKNIDKLRLEKEKIKNRTKDTLDKLKEN